MDTKSECLPKEEMSNKDLSKTTNLDSIFLRENINQFSDELFQENARRFSRYSIERQWISVVKSNKNDTTEQSDKQTEIKLSCWKYPGRKMGRAVSEPNMQTTRVLGTRSLQKSNSFHDLCDVKQQQQQKLKPYVVDSFKPKPITWSYVTKAQCYSINSTKTDADLIQVFHDAFEWETPSEQTIMSRLFADVAKYCTESEFTDEKMSTLLGSYFYSHLFNKSLVMLSYGRVYEFFKELIIHHSFLIPPDHVKLFSPEEAKSLLDYFSNKYLICLPLIRHICVPSSILHVKWKRNGSSQTIG